MQYFSRCQEVIAEAVYVLAKVYKTDRKTVHSLIDVVLSDENSTIPHQLLVEEAMDIYAQTKFDFVDCLMVGYAKYQGHAIVTFDKKLKKYLTRSLEQ